LIRVSTFLKYPSIKEFARYFKNSLVRPKIKDRRVRVRVGVRVKVRVED
jgi:hypothetical protein